MFGSIDAFAASIRSCDTPALRAACSQLPEFCTSGLVCATIAPPTRAK
ncbi:hypothetical protein [Frigoriglobus tundricola]|nr:hypothetical protein [Frigoriglobus tundricola]